MEKSYRKKGVKYIAPAVGSILLIVKKMTEIAKKENAFCYADANGTPIVVEPGMNLGEAVKAFRDARDGKCKVAIYDTKNDFSADAIFKGMAKMAKDNDFVICSVNGTAFRIKRGMTEQDASNILESIRQDEFLEYQKNRGKNYTPELKALIKDEVFEPYDKSLWQSLNSNRIIGRDMEDVEVYGRVMSHLMKEQKADKPNAEMLEQTLDLVRQHTNFVVNESSDNIIVEYLIATWKHGEELAHSMKDHDWAIDYYRKSLEKYGEKPSLPISNGRGGNGE